MLLSSFPIGTYLSPLSKHFVLSISVRKNYLSKGKSHLFERSANSGCLPHFWHRILWLFPEFFLVFLDSRSTFYKLFPDIYPLKIKKIFNSSKFWNFFFNLLFLKKDFLISLIFPDFSLTFQGIMWIPWLFPDFPDLVDTL